MMAMADESTTFQQYRTSKEVGMSNLTKPGAEPSQAQLSYVSHAESRGRPPRDSVLIARHAGVAIWQTEKSATYEDLNWCPPFGSGADVLYRGFAITQLAAVLETGLDVPPQSAFFATSARSYAWEHPHNRDIAALMVIDRSHTERSFVVTGSATGGQPSIVDKVTYPHEYVHEGTRVHTRFDHTGERGTRTFTDEERFGFWIPGDAHAALVAVVLGGPQSTILQTLEACAPHGLEQVR